MSAESARKQAPYSREEIFRYLAFLAQGLKEHHRSVFLIERLQPSWLPLRSDQRNYLRVTRFAGALFVAFAVLLLQFVWEPPVSYALFGTVIALVMGLLTGWILYRIEWDRVNYRHRLATAFLVVFGLLLLFTLRDVTRLVMGFLNGADSPVLYLLLFASGLLPGLVFALFGAGSYGASGRVLFGSIMGAVGGLMVTLVLVRLTDLFAPPSGETVGSILTFDSEYLIVFGMLGGLLGAVLSWVVPGPPAWTRKPFAQSFGALVVFGGLPGLTIGLLLAFVPELQSGLSLLGPASEPVVIQLFEKEYVFQSNRASKFLSSVLLSAPIIGLLWGWRARRGGLSYEVVPVERLVWQGRGTFLGALAGVGFGLVVGLIIAGPQERFPLIVLMVTLVSGLGGALIGGLRAQIPAPSNLPNQGIRLSLRTARYVGLWVTGLSLVGYVGGSFLLARYQPAVWAWLGHAVVPDQIEFASFMPLALLRGGALSLSAGALTWLWFGGLDAFNHFWLRRRLTKAGHAPWDYAAFLEFATHELGFLRRLGGGYTFEHRDLLEHFASQSDHTFDLPAKPAIATAPPGQSKNPRTTMMMAIFGLLAFGIVGVTAAVHEPKDHRDFAWKDADSYRTPVFLGNERAFEVTGDRGDAVAWSLSQKNGELGRAFDLCGTQMAAGPRCAAQAIAPAPATLVARLPNATPMRSLLLPVKADYQHDEFLAAYALDESTDASVAEKYAGWLTFEESLPDPAYIDRAWYVAQPEIGGKRYSLREAVELLTKRKAALSRAPRLATVIPRRQSPSTIDGLVVQERAAITICRGQAGAYSGQDMQSSGGDVRCPSLAAKVDGVVTLDRCAAVSFVATFYWPESAGPIRMRWEVAGRGERRDGRVVAMHYVPGPRGYRRNPKFYSVTGTPSDGYLRTTWNGFNAHRGAGNWELRFVNENDGSLMGRVPFNTVKSDQFSQCVNYAQGAETIYEAVQKVHGSQG